MTTPFSFFASVSAILRAGATPVLADIDPATFNLDPVAVEAVLDSPQGATVRAILPVHLYGQPADWRAFARIGREHGLMLIEDAAQAWGAEWHGMKAGALGDAAAFSFYPTKNLSAAGDAGMVTTNQPELAERVRMLRQHGMRRRYHHDEVGWNARMDGIPGRDSQREAQVHRRLEPLPAHGRQALSRAVSRRRAGANADPILPRRRASA